MARPGSRRWFMMPPASTPEPDQEQKQFIDVYAVLRDHVAYAAAIRSEIRQVRREQIEQRQELAMKVSELSSKVDTLIGVATDLKGRVDNGGASQGTGVVTQPAEDDPEVERLAHRIDDAIAVLRGDKNVGVDAAPVQPPPNAFPDPNAPVNPAEAPPFRDPNQPV